MATPAQRGDGLTQAVGHGASGFWNAAPQATPSVLGGPDLDGEPHASELFGDMPEPPLQR